MKTVLASLLVASATASAVLAAEPGAPGAGGPGGMGGVTPEMVFTNNDTNKDGVITKDEAVKAGRNLGQSWDLADANKDGKADVEEIKKWLAARAAGGGAQGGAAPAPAGAAPAGAPPAAK